jgi:hypothetical protein
MYLSKTPVHALRLSLQEKVLALAACVAGR